MFFPSLTRHLPRFPIRGFSFAPKNKFRVPMNSAPNLVSLLRPHPDHTPREFLEMILSKNEDFVRGNFIFTVSQAKPISQMVRDNPQNRKILISNLGILLKACEDPDNSQSATIFYKNISQFLIMVDGVGLLQEFIEDTTPKSQPVYDRAGILVAVTEILSWKNFPVSPAEMLELKMFVGKKIHQMLTEEEDKFEVKTVLRLTIGIVHLMSFYEHKSYPESKQMTDLIYYFVNTPTLMQKTQQLINGWGSLSVVMVRKNFNVKLDNIDNLQFMQSMIKKVRQSPSLRLAQTDHTYLDQFLNGSMDGSKITKEFIDVFIQALIINNADEFRMFFSVMSQISIKLKKFHPFFLEFMKQHIMSTQAISRDIEAFAIIESFNLIFKDESLIDIRMKVIELVGSRLTKKNSFFEISNTLTFLRPIYSFYQSRSHPKNASPSQGLSEPQFKTVESVLTHINCELSMGKVSQNLKLNMIVAADMCLNFKMWTPQYFEKMPLHKTIWEEIEKRSHGDINPKNFEEFFNFIQIYGSSSDHNILRQIGQALSRLLNIVNDPVKIVFLPRIKDIDSAINHFGSLNSQTESPEQTVAQKLKLLRQKLTIKIDQEEQKSGPSKANDLFHKFSKK